MNADGVQWVPVANLQDTLNNYALKFEIAVKKPWLNGSIQIVKDYTWTYSALYRPWKNANGSVMPFKTNGWQTVTIPLSNFLSNGLPASTLTALLGPTGKGAINVTVTNDGTTVVADFEAAIDNIRVVKVK